mmetsp:Transcript_17702/g.67329  ORF Transcript_17702/g.67329 Transcript_17702/m.67329 type:complete len:254 (+) Transcript_17702:784-1545(+)
MRDRRREPAGQVALLHPEDVRRAGHELHEGDAHYGLVKRSCKDGLLHGLLGAVLGAEVIVSGDLPIHGPQKVRVQVQIKQQETGAGQVPQRGRQGRQSVCDEDVAELHGLGRPHHLEEDRSKRIHVVPVAKPKRKSEEDGTNDEKEPEHSANIDLPRGLRPQVLAQDHAQRSKEAPGDEVRALRHGFLGGDEAQSAVVVDLRRVENVDVDSPEHDEQRDREDRLEQAQDQLEQQVFIHTGERSRAQEHRWRED